MIFLRVDVGASGDERRGHLGSVVPRRYMEDALARIVQNAAWLPSRWGLNAWTFSTLFRPDGGHGAAARRGTGAR